MLFTKAENRFQNQLIYALPIEEQYVTIIQMDNGGIIQLHKLTKIGNDYSDLILVATHYCEQGKMVKILPEIHEFELEARKLIMPGVKGNKNPDLLIDGLLTEVESTDKFYNIANRITRGSIQANRVVIVYKTLIHEISINKTISILFHQHQTLENVTILNDKGVMLLNAKRP